MKTLPLVIGTLLLSACGGGGSSGTSTTNTSTATSRLNLILSDAPVEQAQKVCIAISALRLKLTDDPDEHLWTPLTLLPPATEQDGCLPDGYTIPLGSDGLPRFFYLDLLHYQQGEHHALLSDSEIPAGSYEQLRLMVEDGRTYRLDGDDPHPSSYVLDDSGQTLPLEVPSSELKLHGFTAAADGVLHYQLEFNLRHAMVLPGHGRYYKLKPNGVALLEVATLSTLQGQVTDTLCGGALDAAGVYLYPARNGSTLGYQGLSSEVAAGGPLNTTLLQSATSSSAASYRFFYIEPGSYDLALVCNAASDKVVDEDEASSVVPVIGSLVTGLTVDPAVTTTPTQDLLYAPTN